MELEEIIEQQEQLEESLEQLGHSLKQDLCSQRSSEDEGNQLLINNSSSSRSRSSKKIQKSSSNCNLSKICRDSHKIMRRASVPLPAVQYRRPIIIHTYSPKVLHIEPSKFRWLVQSLTGSSETRSRCLKSPPADLNTDAAATATIDSENHGNTHAQYASSSPSSPHDHDPAHNSREASNLYPQQSSAHNHTQEYLPQPNHMHIGNPNPAINHTHDHLITSGFSPNLANDLNYYYNHNIDHLHQLSSSSCRSTKDVSPTGPLSATEFEDASALSTTPPPAPAFDNWSFDHLDNNISAGLLQGPCSLNYFSNLSVPPPNLSGNNDFPSNYTTINATPWAVDSLLISNTTIPSPCIFRQIPIWDNPLDTILYSIQ